jgi:hypothetical protein
MLLGDAMAFASLSAEVRAPGMLRELEISNSFVAALCRIDEAKLSKALRLLRELSNDEAERLMSTLHRLLEIRGALAPLSFDKSSALQTRRLLDSLSHLSADEIRERVSLLYQ